MVRFSIASFVAKALSLIAVRPAPNWSVAIYFINKAVWRLPVTADKFPVKPFLPYNNTLYYGLTINPVNSEVYIADAIDYVQNGVVLRYSPDGELLDEFYVGIIPGAFCWR